MNDSERGAIRLVALICGLLILIAATLWIVWQMRSIWPPFFVAFVIAIALAPVVDRLESRGVPRWIGTLIVYVGLFSVVSLMLIVLVPLVADQIGEIVYDLRTKFRLDEPTRFAQTMAEHIRILGRQYQVPAFVLTPIVQQAKQSANLLTAYLESFGRLLLQIAPSLIWVVLVPIVAFYAVVDYHRIFAKMLLMVPRSSRDEIRSIASEVTVVFGKYLRGLGIVCLLNTVATIAVLLLFAPTKPYAAALGLIAGILYAVPYIGAVLSTALISLVALAAPQGGSFGMMVGVTLSMLALHQLLFDQVLTPRILGGHVGLHPILSIMALTGGHALFGIAGMLLAVPVAASLQVIIVHIFPRLGRRLEVRVQDEEAPAVEIDPERNGPAYVVTAGEGRVGSPEPLAGGNGGREGAEPERAHSLAPSDPKAPPVV